MDGCTYAKEIERSSLSTPENFTEIYSSEPDDGEETVTWECPHPAHQEEEDRCIFHLESDDRDEVPAQEIRQAFLDRIASGDQRSNQFVGAYLPALDLHHQTISVDGPSQIILDAATIGYIDIRDSCIEPALVGNDATIGLFIGLNTQFDGAIEFEESSLGMVEIACSSHSRRFCLYESEIESIGAERAQFEGVVDITDTIIHQGAEFSHTSFDRVGNFSGTEFRSEEVDLDAESSQVQHRTNRMIIHPMYGLRRSTTKPEPDERFKDETESSERVKLHFSGRSFSDTQYVHYNDIRRNGADFRDASFSREARFDEARFEYADFARIETPHASFVDAEVQGVIYFSASELDRGDFRFNPIDVGVVINANTDRPSIDLRNKARVYLDEATVETGRLMQPESGRVFYDVQHASIGDVVVKPTKTAFDNLIIGATNFDGFDFPKYRDSLQAVEWEIDEVPLSIIPNYKPNMSRREVTYLKAKQGAKAVGDSVSVSEFFQKEMNFRKNLHQLDITEASLWEMWSGIGHFVANDLYRLTTGYGERVSRVVGSYFAFTLGISAFITLLFLPENPSVFVDTTLRLAEILLLGSVSELPSWLQPLFRLFDRIVVPAFVALLVFTLSRSVER